MAILKSSIPYAKALYELAKEKGILAQVKADMMSIKEVIRQSAEFSDVIANPTVASSQKSDIIQNIFSGKVQGDTLGLLQLLIKKGRISELESVADVLIDMVNKSTNTAHVRLTTATQLSDTVQRQIASNVIGSDSYELESIVDPAIIGGYVLEYDNKMLDQSVRSQLHKIKTNLN